MPHDPAEHDELLDHVNIDRRRFVGRVLLGSAFAAPVVSSFSMTGVNAVFAQDTNVSGQPAVGGTGATQSTTTTAGNTTTTTAGNTTTTTGGNTTTTTIGSNTTQGSDGIVN